MAEEAAAINVLSGLTLERSILSTDNTQDGKKTGGYRRSSCEASTKQVRKMSSASKKRYDCVRARSQKVAPLTIFIMME
jgi:hypothetical protein